MTLSYKTTYFCRNFVMQILKVLSQKVSNVFQGWVMLLSDESYHIFHSKIICPFVEHPIFEEGLRTTHTPPTNTPL